MVKMTSTLIIILNCILMYAVGELHTSLNPKHDGDFIEDSSKFTPDEVLHNSQSYAHNTKWVSKNFDRTSVDIIKSKVGENLRYKRQTLKMPADILGPGGHVCAGGKPVYTGKRWHCVRDYLNKKIRIKRGNILLSIFLDRKPLCADGMIPVRSGRNWHCRQSKRNKREDVPWIWDDCPAKMHYEVVDGNIQCIKDEADSVFPELADRVFQSEVCAEGKKKVSVGGRIRCLNVKKRKRNTNI